MSPRRLGLPELPPRSEERSSTIPATARAASAAAPGDDSEIDRRLLNTSEEGEDSPLLLYAGWGDRSLDARVRYMPPKRRVENKHSTDFSASLAMGVNAHIDVRRRRRRG
jgi:hypothetical protein